MQKHISTDIYAARIKDKKKLEQSSSGGAFTAIAEYFIENTDAVACCYYNYESNCAEYKLMFSADEVATAKGSKYIYSFLGEIYNECIQWLVENPEKHLLFVGTGCQAAGFCRFSEIKQLRDRVTVVDLICHGIPSPIIWNSYVAYLERKYKGSIQSISFRDKRRGWINSTAVAVINEKEVSLKGYVRLYYDARAMRPSCYKCPYTKINRYTDITIGDYWGIEKSLPEFYNYMGNSLVLLHTEQGKTLFSHIMSKMEYATTNAEACWQYNLEFPTKEPHDRKQFWDDYHNKGRKYIIKKYAHPTFVRKICNRLKNNWMIRNLV